MRGECFLGDMQKEAATKVFLRSVWMKMKVVSLATSENATIRKDDEGKHWEWTAIGKRVTAKLVN